jgi:predicted transcriptional regulator
MTQQHINEIKNDLVQIESKLVDVAKLASIDNSVLFLAKLISLMNETSYSEKQIFILFYGIQLDKFTQAEIFNLLGMQHKKITFRDVFKGNNGLNHHEIISVVDHEKSHKGNKKIYSLTKKGRDIATKILKQLKQI